MTPFEAMTDTKPNLAKMHIFGQTSYAMIQNPKKLSDRAQKGIFIGYDKYSPAYLIYICLGFVGMCVCMYVCLDVLNRLKNY